MVQKWNHANPKPGGTPDINSIDQYKTNQAQGYLLVGEIFNQRGAENI